MTIAFNKAFNTDRYVYLFICAHLFFWTLIPLLVRYNLPLDAIEGTIWGHQLQWGYDKNPFLNGWLTALAIHLGGPSGWMIYLFSQLSVAICFLAIWQLANKMLPPLYALITVMLLEGVQYYHLHSIDFNDNTLELSLWALTIYFFYQALISYRKVDEISWAHRNSGAYKSWLLTGLFAGLGMMAKYYTAALLAAMALFLLFNSENRKQLKTWPPYIGLITFLIVLLPHTIWLFYHDFITILYVFERGSSSPSWTNRFFYPTQFAWQQLQAFLPALAFYALLFIGKKPMTASPMFRLSDFNRSFLLYVGLGPFLLTLLLSLTLGTKLRAGWGMPLLSTWGILLVALIQPNMTKKKIIRFITFIFLFMGFLLSGYAISLIHSSSPSSANFPGREIARVITAEWHETYHTKLDYVGGSRWISGNISFYSPDHPAVFIEWDKKRAPWIDMTSMEQKGAIFVWDITHNETLPAAIRKRFPQLQTSFVLTFPWYRDKKNLMLVKMGVAILGPAQQANVPLHPPHVES